MGTDANPSCPMGWALHPTHPGRLKQGAVRGTPPTHRLCMAVRDQRPRLARQRLLTPPN